MTNDEILQAAKDATNNQPIYGRKEFTFSAEELQRFVATIEKRTIERCAAICDSVNNYDNPMTATDCAAAIRAME